MMRVLWWSLLFLLPGSGWGKDDVLVQIELIEVAHETLTELRMDPELVDETIENTGQFDSLDKMTLFEMEKVMIEKSLVQHENNISKVADALGLSRAALYRRLDKHGLSH